MASFKEQIPGFVTGAEIEKAAANCAHEASIGIHKSMGLPFYGMEASSTEYFMFVYKACMTLVLVMRPELDGEVQKALQGEFPNSWQHLYSDILKEANFRRSIIAHEAKRQQVAQ